MTEQGDKEIQPVLDDSLHNYICGEIAATVHQLENATLLRFLQADIALGCENTWDLGVQLSSDS